MIHSYLINDIYRGNTSFPNGVGLSKEPRLLDYRNAEEQSQHHTLRHFISNLFRKLSMIPLKFIRRLFHPRDENMIYRKCTKSDNPADLDTYKTNDLGFMELVHCCNKEKQTKEVHRY